MDDNDSGGVSGTDNEVTTIDDKSKFNALVAIATDETFGTVLEKLEMAAFLLQDFKPELCEMPVVYKVVAVMVSVVADVESRAQIETETVERLMSALLKISIFFNLATISKLIAQEWTQKHHVLFIMRLLNSQATLIAVNYSVCDVMVNRAFQLVGDHLDDLAILTEWIHFSVIITTHANESIVLKYFSFQFTSAESCFQIARQKFQQFLDI
ncbi:hypothetical protein HDE_08014 [Halotydeus destructor]|nr:hypothetical protein HDE_08014 [Halotydeus destructor]